jgi:hypothetical protein
MTKKQLLKEAALRGMNEEETEDFVAKSLLTFPRKLKAKPKSKNTLAAFHLTARFIDRQRS